VSDFVEFPKIHRFNRNIIVSEKIDGTNAQIHISDDGLTMRAGSRNRWVTPENDNYGFARWVEENREELLKLGPGHHYGEWWGAGIQRRYDQDRKRFSLFNVSRWTDDKRPACCDVVPTLFLGTMCGFDADAILSQLATEGSKAAPGFMKPEGIVIFHSMSQALFKMTLDKNDAIKGTADINNVGPAPIERLRSGGSWQSILRTEEPIDPADPFPAFIVSAVNTHEQLLAESRELQIVKARLAEYFAIVDADCWAIGGPSAAIEARRNAETVLRGFLPAADTRRAEASR
jgi:hypothetical protein